jgi:LysR family transcriptional regulator, benzoate and cis,cis-muconate-responsive activator of ben and cat genes
MELRYLRSFLEVARLGHVGRASEALDIAQPSLSYQIARLEESFGEPLFERSRRGMELTAAGRALLEEIRPIIQRIDGIADRVRAAARGHTGALAIGLVSGAFLSGAASRIIRAYRAQHPQVQVRVRAVLHAPLVRMLQSGEVDLAVFGSTLGDADFVGQPLLREAFAAVLPADHRLASRKVVRYRDLAGETLIMLSRDAAPALFTHTLAVCAQHGFEPGAIEETAGEDAVIGLVAAGSGVAVIPDSWGAIQIEGAATRKLSPAGEGVTLRLYHRADNESPLVRSFLRSAKPL